MSKDYMKAFARLMESSFTRYNGCLIRHDGDKYSWADKTFDTLEEAQGEIDRSFRLLENIINRLKK